MRVTGIIPVFNHERWVNQAIDSMLKQTRPPERLVIVDDASTDGSFDAVLRRLKNPHNCDRYIQGTIFPYKTEIRLTRLSENGGPALSRNIGIELGEADIYAFLDSDDLYLPTKIERSLPKFDNPAVGVVYSDYYTFNDNGLELKNFKEPFSAKLFSECIVNCDSLVHRRVFEQCGNFDESLRCVEDFDLWIRIAEKYLITHVPEILLKIRVGEHSSSFTVNKTVWEGCYRRVFEKRRLRNG